MNVSLLRKSFREGFALLLGSALFLFAFMWIRVWVTSQFKVGSMRKILSFIPDFATNFLPVPPDVIASPAGRIAIGYDDPLVVVPVSIWVISRSSDIVSGELGRGTMEMLLAQPVKRTSVMVAPILVTILGLLLLVGSAWLGTFAGIATVTLEEETYASCFLPAAVNLFCLGFSLAGLTTLLSSGARYRSRTIGVAVGFVVVQALIKIVALSVPAYAWMKYITILTLFEPQVMAYNFWPEMLQQDASRSWWLLINYNYPFLIMGVVCYIVAVLIFCKRDLPAPL